eukprot:CAMPEP_0185839990 /NCGR_PEP_ID=MMETSP1353-20130828/15511_1 /TAXON_ID=1077150 /ORGANISM="Erythrolobus australicus, Strain CCMP3124" /LENGTH=349 /DNA_ID=CAMNT_0028539247 /DNA_START=117 /DNA_END=1166 /DNA_ORIENTATION=-
MACAHAPRQPQQLCFTSALVPAQGARSIGKAVCAQRAAAMGAKCASSSLLLPNSHVAFQHGAKPLRRTRAIRAIRMMATDEAGSATPLIDLRGKKALVTGIANNKSIAWGIAQSLKQAGAEIGISYLPMSDKVESKIRSLTEPLAPTLFVPLDVQKPEDLEALGKSIASEWGGQVDIVVHCLAFANRDDLTGSFMKTSVEGWNTATTVSAHSLLSLTNAVRPYLTKSASIVTLSYLGAVKVVPNYNVMGVAKAALEASTRYLASELGPDGIRVNAISAGPIRTLASSAIGGIMTMIKHVESVSPLRRTVSQKQVGDTAAFLVSDASAGITGQVIYVDSGYEIMGVGFTE